VDEHRSAILDVIRTDWTQPVPQSAFAIAEALCARHGSAVGAVLFYGSCLRSGSDRDSLLDLYLLVDSYRDCYPGRGWVASANALLPPNVFYYEQPWEERRIRAKYAVISFQDFAAGAGRRAVLPAIWARFSQPTVLLCARDTAARRETQSAVAEAIVTMALRTAPLIEGPIDAREFWTTGYRRSYEAEARVEGSGRATQLLQPLERYESLLRPALGAAGVLFSEAGEERVRIALSEAERRRGLAYWSRASAATRLHTIPRLAKAALTFEGGLDYALWKVERHSGVKLEAGPWARRHPILAALPLIWRAYRRGAFRRA
jgi:hypothetical protein